MESQKVNPKNYRITDASWGKINVACNEDNKTFEFKDVKLFPEGCRKWDWNETGTRHSPGIQVADIKELIDNGAEILILSLGMECVLKVDSKTEIYLNSIGIEYEKLQTEKAVEKYNLLLKENRKVGGLFHSTC